MKKKPVRSLTAITARLAVFTLLLWGLSMFLATAAVAHLLAEQFYDEYRDLAASQANRGRLDDWRDETLNETPGRVEYRMWESVQNYNWGFGSVLYEGFSPLSGVMGDYNEATLSAIYDSEGSLLAEHQDCFYFGYFTEENWYALTDTIRPDGYAVAPFDRACLTEAGKAWLAEAHRHYYSPRVIRVTGAFEGATLIPTKIDYISEFDVFKAQTEGGSGHYTINGVILSLNIPWVTLYENPGAVSDGARQVTLYGDDPEVMLREDTGPITFKGVPYEHLRALLESIGPSLAGGTVPNYLNQYNLTDVIQLDTRYYFTYAGEDLAGTYHGENAYVGEIPKVDFYLVSVAWFSPLLAAAATLRKVYIATFVLAAVGVLLLRSSIKHNLTRTVEAVNKAMAEGYTWRYPPQTDADWREAVELREHYCDTYDTLRLRQNEINRLTAALEYAKTAEENRRQMTSAIAHELKTPLAVVHSHAEGLKERIAEEKRDKYLDTILAESEKMDAMVLEMLDLSRLEAGKVKLARDPFSLAQLTKTVFESLTVEAEKKGLSMELDLKEICPVSADEGRIAQVISNFASNAVRYAPEGSTIRVKTFSLRGLAGLSVSNDSRPFTDEELSKVWETFYRTDKARDRKGTGLGLAIAKSIVELHGGTCSARNIPNGVEFRFQIPQ